VTKRRAVGTERGLHDQCPHYEEEHEEQDARAAPAAEGAVKA